ncbi:urocate hydratase [Daphnia sinensis]|uniref:urocanate hydratase n=1 Tax=Daphnia sinensis TaxID=1820382 RepID=A0AAD5KF48_9CRUS|nr:urocate hydratase [Daphnia sinensis]
MTFKDQLIQGIPTDLPPKKKRDSSISHAPKRKDILSLEEKKLALRNSLRYFPKKWHEELAAEFFEELEAFGRIYMYRFQPDYPMFARAIQEYPAKTQQASAIMLMIQNNLDPAVAQHPQELITYGGNGAVFQNWAQYLLTMKFLAEMTESQTLHIYSGHPMGLFPSSPDAPRVVVTNGMMIPNYSKSDDWERFNALGVTQYGQMTAGSYMYIGPQGIVHGTTITVMNAFRRKLQSNQKPKGKIFLTSGLGGMSGAQPKAGNIAGCITICAEVNPAAARKRHSQGWVDELIENIEDLVSRVRKAKSQEEIVSIAFLGNVVDVWERLDQENILVEIGSDQTSLHNPWSGGYYPVGLSFEESNQMMAENPNGFKVKVQESLLRQSASINRHVAKGTYFFDYGNAFLLEASRTGADVMAENGIDFKYPSYVQDILGPICFDYGFGPFRWVCTSADAKDLRKSDQIAARVLKEIIQTASASIQQQMQDNITWIEEAEKNKLVVGSQARILYADAEGRAKIAKAFNDAINSGEITAPIGTDSPYRETSNIYDGSKFTADMAIHNVIGDSFRGATWVSIHNGGGVGWGEVINGGFGMLLDGSAEAERKLKSMLFYDVNNGIARRAWARNTGSLEAIQREMDRRPDLKITLPNLVNDEILEKLFG